MSIASILASRRDRKITQSASGSVSSNVSVPTISKIMNETGLTES